MSTSLNKKELRRCLFARVKAIGEQARADASERIVSKVIDRSEWDHAQDVLLYAALPSEPNLWALFDRALVDEKRVYFTAIEDDRIVLYRVVSREHLREGAFGILEPDPSRCERLDSPESIELMLIPGVGFDQVHRSRLGRGKGHYDRFLEFYRTRGGLGKAIGVCFSVQLDDVPLEAHDQPMDHILSEAGWDRILWVVGLGSNLGDRELLLDAACEALRVEHRSQLFETEPVDCPPGAPLYLNGAVSLVSELGPFQLLRKCQDLEVALGRPRDHEHHASRTVDLDLLFAGDAHFELSDLILPHPRILEREFVMFPLSSLLEQGGGGEISAMRAVLDRAPASSIDGVRLSDSQW